MLSRKFPLLQFHGRWIVLTLLFVLFAACEKQQEHTDYVARIGQSVLTQEDLEGMLTSLSSPEVPLPTQQVIQQWATRELLYLEAVNEGLTKDMDLEHTVADYRKSLYGSAFLDIYLSNAVLVTRDEITHFYKTSRSSFRRHKPEVRVLHFILGTQEEALEVRSLLLRYDGATRQNLINDYLIDVKTVPQGDLLPELDREIFGLPQPRGVLGPVESRHGYHVMEILEFYPQNSYRGLDELYDEISQTVFRSKSRHVYRQLLDSLKSIYNLEINPSYIGRE